MTNPQVTQLIDFLMANGISDRNVLDAIRRTPRHNFVSQVMSHQAYDNNALPIGLGQTISQPYIVAKMIQLLQLQRDSVLLEVGTGSGYQTAVLSHLVDHVNSIERIKSLQWDAKRRLKQLDIYNVSTKHGDGWQGWQSKGPFDAIIVSAAAVDVPQALLLQLNEGGKMVIPVGDTEQQLLLITRQGDTLSSTVIEDVRFVPLVEGELA